MIVGHHGRATKKILHSSSPKTALKDISFTFYLTDEKYQIDILYCKTFEENNCIEELGQNQLKTNYVEFHIHAEKNHLWFLKALEIKLLSLSAARSLLKKHLPYQV